MRVFAFARALVSEPPMSRIPAVLLAAALLAAPVLANAQDGALNVEIDRSARVQLRGAAASIIVANPQIADVSMVDANTRFIVGKGYGVTEVVAVSVGVAQAQEALRTALAIGADRAILVESNDGVEPLGVAKVLKALVDQEQPQLVILGKQAIDDDSNQTGQMLAALAGLPQATFASKVTVADGRATVAREVDGGAEAQ